MEFRGIMNTLSIWVITWPFGSITLGFISQPDSQMTEHVSNSKMNDPLIDPPTLFQNYSEIVYLDHLARINHPRSYHGSV